jgi:nucleoside-diphosphate-sugar epimerase
MKLLVFGCGYSGRRFVMQQGHRFASIVGTVRDPSRAEPPAQARLLPFDGLLPTPELTAAIAEADAILVSIAPGESGDPVLNVFAEAIRQAPRLRWIGYLSTIGVYGDRGGDWVSEDEACHPVSERSIRRLAAEGAWREIGAIKAVPTAIFRLAGIYGPGRNVLRDLRAGTARRLIKPGQVFNRIHVDDIARVVAAAVDRMEGGLFNVCDDAPGPPQDVVTYAAALLGVEPPPEIPFENAVLSPMARSFYAENKRVSNVRMSARLGVSLAFPSYREGYDALFAAGEGR